MSPYDAIAIAVALLACVFDLRERRIPNALTFSAALAAFAAAAMTGGVHAVGLSAAGFGIGLVFWLPIYALGGMGAGDVKLLAAIGAWLGPLGVIHAALATAIAGALLAIVVAIAKRRVRQTSSNIALLLVHWQVAGFSPKSQLTLDSATSPRLAYAVPTLIGTVIAIWFR